MVGAGARWRRRFIIKPAGSKIRGGWQPLSNGSSVRVSLSAKPSRWKLAVTRLVFPCLLKRVTNPSVQRGSWPSPFRGISLLALQSNRWNLKISRFAASFPFVAERFETNGEVWKDYRKIVLIGSRISIFEEFVFNVPQKWILDKNLLHPSNTVTVRFL